MTVVDLSRREVLKRALAAGGAATVAIGTVDTAAARDDESAVPAPFDELPTIDDPSQDDREQAQVLLPPRAVPDTGPIPDYRHNHTVEREITVPEWVLEAVRWRLQHCNSEEVTRAQVERFIIDYAYITERYVTPDGRDAVGALLEEVTEADR